MKPIIQPFSIALLAGAISLSGCGGGGSDNQQETVLSPRSVNDTEVSSFSLATLSNDSLGERIDSVGTQSNNLDARIEGQNLIVDPRDQDRPTTETLILSNAQGETVASLEVAIIDVEGEAIAQQSSQWTRQLNRLLALDEDRAVLRVAANSAYALGEITAQQRDRMQGAGSDPNSENALNVASNALQQGVNDYQRSAIGNSELDQRLQAMRNAARVHRRQTTLPALQEVFAAISRWETPTGVLSLDPETGEISAYVGDPTLGARNANSDWVFNDEAVHIESALEMNELAICQGSVL